MSKENYQIFTKNTIRTFRKVLVKIILFSVCPLYLQMDYHFQVGDWTLKQSIVLDLTKEQGE